MDVCEARCCGECLELSLQWCWSLDQKGYSVTHKPFSTHSSIIFIILWEELENRSTENSILLFWGEEQWLHVRL